MKAGVERIDECLAVLEVHVEGSLRYPGLGDDAVDAEAGEAVLFGDRNAGVQQGIARAVPRRGGCSRRHPHQAT